MVTSDDWSGRGSGRRLEKSMIPERYACGLDIVYDMSSESIRTQQELSDAKTRRNKEWKYMYMY